MKVVVQRVRHASVTIDGNVHGKINTGFLVLLGISSTDSKQDVDYLVKKWLICEFLEMKMIR